MANQDGKNTNIRLIDIPTHIDDDGDMSVLEFDDSLPFKPRRAFYVYNVGKFEQRVHHARKLTKQLLICVNGTITAALTRGTFKEYYTLADPAHGLYVPPLTWGELVWETEGGVLLVLASTHYTPVDSITDFDEYLKFFKTHGGE